MYSSSVGSVLFICLVLKSANSMDQTQEICSFLKPGGKYEGIGLYKRYSSNRSPDNVPHLMYNKKGQELNFKLSEDHTLITMTEKGINYTNSKIVNRFGIYFKAYITSLWLEYWANCYVTKEEIKSIQCYEFGEKYVRSPISNPQSIIFRAHSTEEIKDWNSHYTIILSKYSKEKLYFSSYPYWDIDGKFLEYNTESFCTSIDCPDTRFIDSMNESLVSRLDAVLDINTGNYKVAGYLLVFNIDGSPMFCYQSAGEDLSDNCKYSENLKPVFDHCFDDKSKELSNDSIDPLIWVFIVEVILGAILVYLILRMIDIRRERWEQQNSEETNTRNSDTT